MLPMTSGKRFLVGKNRKRFSKWDCYVYSRQCGRQGWDLLLEISCCIHRGSRLILLFSLVKDKLSVLDGPSILVEFIDWVRYKQGNGCFFAHSGCL